MNEDRVIIEMPGHPPIATTIGAMTRATAALALGNELKRKSRTMAKTSNTGIDGRAEQTSARVAEDQLRAIIERIEAVEEEKQAKLDDLKEIYAEAKGNGYEVKALKRIVRLRKLDGPQKAAHDEVESIFEIYMNALGML